MDHPPLPLSAVYIPNEDPVEKTLFSLAINCQLEMASWLGMAILFPFFLPVLRTSLAWSCTGPVHAATIPMSSFILPAVSVRLCLKDSFLGVIHPLWLLQSFCLLLYICL